MSTGFLNRQISQELQRQGASASAAQESARYAVEVYERGSRSGQASLQQTLKAAGEYCEKIERGFKYKSRR